MPPYAIFVIVRTTYALTPCLSQFRVVEARPIITGETTDRAAQEQVFAEIKGCFGNSVTKLSNAEMYHRTTTYTNQEHHDRERDVMRRYPVIVGRSSSVAKSGDFFTNDSTGVPIIVSRQADGSLKALLNICRHRGARVCTEASGHRSNFVCQYQ